jgi:hypothetical protein
MVKACWDGSPKSQVTNVIAEACELPREAGFREIDTL